MCVPLLDSISKNDCPCQRMVTLAGSAAVVDEGTHEVDGIVRVPELDTSDGRQGYGLIDTEGQLTMRFRAAAFDYEAGS